MKRFFLLTAVWCCLISTAYAADCAPVTRNFLVSGLGEMTTDDSNVWSWNSTYSCAYGTAYQKNKPVGYEAHLFTPAFDFHDANTVTVSFSHAHKFGSNTEVANDYTLWVTKDFQGSFAASQWQQLTIAPYASNIYWTYVSVTVTVPAEYLGSNTVFALQYRNGSQTGTWQVRGLTIQSACADGTVASPVEIPDVGDGRIRIFAQNLRNYYVNYDPNGTCSRSKYDDAAFAKKTRQIVDAMFMVGADIFALCEVEAKPEALVQLADSMNKRVEGNPFVAVTDGIDEECDSYQNNIKSGFIYRSDKIKPVGSNYAATNAVYYRNTQRIQTFEEKATGQRFTLAMNHFKAKDSSDDAGNSTRVQNANNLLNGLRNYAADPDILILGDLNCMATEEPVELLVDAGYEEQILKYQSNAFSHCYQSTPELIDHALANTSMAEQITGAGVFHICTSCGPESDKNTAYRYSDHDAYVVAINLTVKGEGECENIDETFLRLNTGLGDMKTEKVSGTYNWRYQAAYGATCQSKGGEAWLLTPTFDMRNMKNVSVAFEHTVNYGNVADMTTQHTMWVTPSYSSRSESEWHQLSIPNYPAGTNWTFVPTTVDVPVEYVGANTVIAFKYDVPAAAANNAVWEIKNLHIIATCSGTEDVIIPSLHQYNNASAHKSLDQGRLILTMPDGTTYNILGLRIK